ncbi:MAG: hydroxyacid dehydrogenase [Solobacterium sp.]|nr:hydroxyacid dehydrogenase [Solobacterium sp.]
MKAVIAESLGISEELLSELEEPFVKEGVEFVSYERTDDTEVLTQELQDADILIVANMPVKGEVIEALDHLKFIDVAFTGVDHIGLSAAEKKHITVSNASGYSNEAVSELVLGMVLSSLRNLRQVEDRCRNGGTKAGLIGQEIKGKTVGIVGLGAIGSRSAELFQAFGAEVIAAVRHPEKHVDSAIPIVSLDEVLKRSDIVVLHCPLNEETRGLINAEKLSLMKPSALLVNVARGPVVNTADLADALNRGIIAGACIDVFDQEPPLHGDPLLEVNHVLVTPHVAFATEESMKLRAEIVFDNLRAWLDGTPKNTVL